MAGPTLIDVHMHISRTREEGHQEKAGGYVIWEYGEKTDVRFSHYGGNLDDALEAIDSAGFSKAVVVNLFGLSSARQQVASELAEGLGPDERARAIETAVVQMLKEFNVWGCELAQPHPQLIPYIFVDSAVLPGETGPAHIRDIVVNHGARGIKLHPVLQELYVGDKAMWPMYETCQELGIPILSHSGPARGGEPFAEPRAFAEPLAAFPRLTFVLAHMGGGTWQQALEIAQTYPNAYFDCCEIIQWTGGPNAPTDRQLARLIKDIGPERVMMGSDFPWYDLDHNADRVMELPVLSKEEKEGMLGANAERILGI